MEMFHFELQSQRTFSFAWGAYSSGMYFALDQYQIEDRLVLSGLFSSCAVTTSEKAKK